jgi:hypothetical protein
MNKTIHCGVVKETFPAIEQDESHGRQELNPQPTVLETVALPVELHPYVFRGQRKTARTLSGAGGA